jgi:Ca-activated chloride channel family protein
MKTIVALFGFILPAIAAADGFMRPIRPPDRPHVQAFAVKYHHVNVTIENQVARVEIDQVFQNPNPFDLEAEYIFPIPDYVAIDKLSMWIDGKEQEGELMDRDKARQHYENIVRQTKDPALLEYMNAKMFRLRVYPVPANGEKRVKLTYSHVINKENGLCTFAYPLNTEKFSSKNLEECKITVNLRAEGSLKNVYSPTHPINTAKKNASEFAVTYEEKNCKPDRDFVLYYAYDESDLGLNLVTHKDYFMLFVSPKHADKAEADAKDIVFVMDTSGSMAGQNIQQAKASLQQFVDSLGRDDRFAIVTFSTEVRTLFEKLEPADKANVVRARKYIQEISARGGTNIQDAMERGLQFFAEKSDRPCYLVFMTDGIPTISETAPEKIAKTVREKNGNRVRIFTLGVGFEVNSVLLNQLGSENKGSSDHVLPEENIEIKVSNLYTKISLPALTDPKIAVGGVRIKDVYPRTIPDIFYGGQVIVYGRFEGSGPQDIELSGKYRGKEISRKFKATFDEKNSNHDYLPRFWVITKVGYLLDQIRLNGEQKELKDEIVALSKEYGIMTPYTSWLVLEDIQNAPPPPPGSVPMPMFKGGMEERDAGRGKIQTGEKAVKAAQAVNDMKQEKKNLDDLSRRQDQAIKNVGDKTFYKVGDRWIDSTLKADAKPAKVKFLSDEYWELLKTHPELAKYQSIGSSMIVVLKNRVVEIE